LRGTEKPNISLNFEGSQDERDLFASIYKDETLAKSQEVECGQREWSEAKSTTSYAGRRIRGLTDAFGPFLIHHEGQSMRGLQRKCTLYQRAKSSWNFKAGVDVNVSDGLEYVSSVLDLTTEWRDVSPIFNVAIA